MHGYLVIDLTPLHCVSSEPDSGPFAGVVVPSYVSHAPNLAQLFPPIYVQASPLASVNFAQMVA